ncbi:desulfoferrodoxin FeS4 iron-binding domain-containing protein [bacterium]|nr:desulfoferrodoxin FeS4 iron-binding domain-containing protein [bacterium]
MTKKLELYKCEICGNIAEIIMEGQGELVCCGEPMKLLTEQKNSTEISEKHMPEISDFKENHKKISVDKHPMLPDHYIEFIEVFSKNKNEHYLKYLLPDEKPEFIVPKSDNLLAREFCNIHGLWGNSFK